jgi:hypothetical protein
MNLNFYAKTSMLLVWLGSGTVSHAIEDGSTDRYYLSGVISEKIGPGVIRNIAIIKDKDTPSRTISVSPGDSLPAHPKMKVKSINRSEVIVSDGITKLSITHLNDTGEIKEAEAILPLIEPTIVNPGIDTKEEIKKELRYKMKDGLYSLVNETPASNGETAVPSEIKITPLILKKESTEENEFFIDEIATDVIHNEGSVEDKIEECEIDGDLDCEEEGGAELLQ